MNLDRPERSRAVRDRVPAVRFREADRVRLVILNAARDAAPKSGGLVDQIAAELHGARRLAISSAIEKLDREIDRVYPPEKYERLLDPAFDWEAE